jgi:N6-L-threonylcarbamoyladenine synthase
MIVLGIETSCDETACGIVEIDKNQNCIMLANTVFSSMDLHKAYGGVVPEIAARSHIESIIPVIEQSLIEAFGSTSTKSEARNPKQIKNSKLETNESRLETQDSDPSPFTTHPSPLTVFEPWSKIDAIAVTHGAGLGGCLLVGVMTARTLAITKSKPLYAINHVEAHVYANFINKTNGLKVESRKLKVPQPSTFNLQPSTNTWQLDRKTYLLPVNQPEFPLLALIVSGGHSQLALFRDHFDYTLLGQTRDDAIGEAFDKVAKITGLPYPGGPSIAEAAKHGDPLKYQLPKSRLVGDNPALLKLRETYSKHEIRSASWRTKSETNSKSKIRNSHLQPSTFNLQLNNHNYDFSFSGLKTAVLRLAQEEIGEDFTFPSHKLPERLSDVQKHDIAASFQRVAIETVVDKAVLAYEEFQPKSVVIAGGVAANQELRRQLTDRIPIEIQYTDIKLCTDNGAMVATLGCFKAMLDQEPVDPYKLQIEPNLSM